MIPDTVVEHAAASDALDVVASLARAIENAGIRCCQWKGQWKLQAPSSAAGDIDLLVRPSDVAWFGAAAANAGFKMARPTARQYPGTLSFYAPSGTQGRFVHLHLHYRLSVGHWSSPHRLPLEEIVLASAERGPRLPVPSPEIELLLRVCNWVAARHWRPTSKAERDAHSTAVSRELEYLMKRTTLARVHDVVSAHLPVIDREVFDDAVLALASGVPYGGRAGRRLRRQFAAVGGGQPLLARITRAVMRVILLSRPSGRVLLCGGRVVAFVGADGSGKSTAISRTREWLAPTFETATAHLGRPPRSLATLFVGLLRRLAAAFAVALAGPSGALTVMRIACTARDRYRLYRRVTSLAARGAIVLCDRYPLPGLGPDGAAFGRSLPVPARGLARILYRVESSYYRRIRPPDLVIVLDVDPEVAARRKRDEDPDYVRARAADMRRLSAWRRDPRLHVIDAGRPVEQVMADVRRRVWTAL